MSLSKLGTTIKSQSQVELQGLKTKFKIKGHFVWRPEFYWP